MRLFASILALCLAKVWAACYFPNGDPSPADVACDADAVDSFCCFHDQACLSNKLCLVNPTESDHTQYVYARGTCTDANWASDACPSFCLDTVTGTGNPVFSCNSTSNHDFCCNNGCSCGNGNEVLSASSAPYTITLIDEPFTNTHTVTASSGSSASSSGSTSSGTASSSGTTSSSSSRTTSSSTSSSSSSNGVAIGVGVGVGVGGAILIVAAVFWFLTWRRRRQRKTKEAQLTAGAAAAAAPPFQQQQHPQYQGQHRQMSEASQPPGYGPYSAVSPHSQAPVWAFKQQPDMSQPPPVQEMEAHQLESEEDAAAVLEQDHQISYEDLCQIPRCTEAMLTGWGCYWHGIRRESSDSSYVGSFMSKVKGMCSRAQIYQSVLNGTCHLKPTAHTLALQSPLLETSFRVLAVFSHDTHGGLVRILETVLMIYLDTVAPQKTFHRFKTREAQEAYQQTVKMVNIAPRPWSPLNSGWPLALGISSNSSNQQRRRCMNKDCNAGQFLVNGRRTVWDTDSGKIWGIGTYRCHACYTYFCQHKTERSAALVQSLNEQRAKWGGYSTVWPTRLPLAEATCSNPDCDGKPGEEVFFVLDKDGQYRCEHCACCNQYCTKWWLSEAALHGNITPFRYSDEHDIRYATCAFDWVQYGEDRLPDSVYRQLDPREKACSNVDCSSDWREKLQRGKYVSFPRGLDNQCRCVTCHYYLLQRGPDWPQGLWKRRLT
ncbi:hypothetical protein NA57DRAFT_50980 [Rhizodiscina lignyota]|uniref:Uncharacterized protein n=1 Tax=Rhizodiscina lignyota TaxID=1504668 RepID=A0A9P4IQW7_9PEZI|nr:hypothetical protein NA57DRAFT_50980 [Rhizodiscina lignyota]